MRVLYSKLSTYRNREFSQKTIITEKDGGEKIVIKEPLYPEGVRHFEEVCKSREALVEIYPGAEINNVYMENGIFYSEYVENAVPLSVFYAEAIKNNDKDKFLKLVEWHINFAAGENNSCKFYETPAFRELLGDGSAFEGEPAASRVNFDFGSGNILFRGGDFKKPVLIDFEWFYNFPVPKLIYFYVVIRAGIFGVNITGINDNFITLEEVINHIFKKHSLNIKNEKILENIFIRYVSYIFKENDGSPVNNIFGQFTVKNNVDIKKLAADSQSTGTFYFDTGSGFNENEKLSFSLRKDSNDFYNEISLPENTINVRFDPVENAGCVLRDLEIISQQGILQYNTCNGFSDDNGNIIFLNTDPQLLITNIKSSSILKINCKILIFSDFEHFRFADRYIRNFENFGSFKTESRGVIERLTADNENLNKNIASLTTEYENLNELNRSTVNELEYYKVHYFTAISQRTEIQERLNVSEYNYFQISNAGFWKITKPARVLFNFIKKIPPVRIALKTLRYIKNYGLKSTYRKIITLRRNSKILSEINVFSDSERKFQKNYKFKRKIKFSILVPLYNTPKNYLIQMIDSVIAQTYSDWELCLADGSGSGKCKYIEKICLDISKKDKRIKYVKLNKNTGISGNSNECAKLANGEYTALLDHDDLLHPSALFEVMKAICEHNAEFIYSDEDKITSDGKSYFGAYYKPDFAIDNLRSNNYICHFTVFKRSLIKGDLFRSEFDGSQDHDLILRLTENTKNIYHIQKVLYHWRASKSSVASDASAKHYTVEAGIKAVKEHLNRLGIGGEVREGLSPNIYRVVYEIKDNPKISIIIPNKDHAADLKKCIDSIVKLTSYKNYEIIIVENNSDSEEIFDYYKKITDAYKNIKTVNWKGGFNYPKINNFGAKAADGDYYLFLNNDIEIISPDWLQEMLMMCNRPEVGAVGAKLYYPDDTIQHGGVILGIGGVAGHSHKHLPRSDFGYFGRLISQQNLSAVTAACMMVKKSVFYKVGEFDERYAVAFNDIDLCMRIREADYLICFTPYAEAYHYESKSRGYEDTLEKQKRFQKEVILFQDIWKKELKNGDPYYNPNLTLEREDFGLR